MKRLPLFWQLFSGYLAIACLSLLALAWYASSALRSFFVRHTAVELESRARLVEKRLAELVLSEDRQALDALAKELGRASATRITVILPSGKVVGDSEEDPSRMDNHADREEVMKALAGEVGSSVRFSRTLGIDMVYVAIPARRDGNTIAVVRTSMPLEDARRATAAIHARIGVAGAALAALAAGVSIVVARLIARPLEAMERGAERFATGDFSKALPALGSAEAARLASAMNRMAAELDGRMRALAAERGEREAILSAMTEGVVAVDGDGRLIGVNAAAASMLGVQADAIRGRSVEECVRNPGLQDIVARALAGPGPVEGEFVLAGPTLDRRERIIQAHGAPLEFGAGRGRGAVIVLDDVTRARRIETVRKEFVANVSHELKTPLTSVKGFVETLREGAEPPEKARRFLEVIAQQVDRTIAIIEDLLLLARIEEQEDKAELETAETEIGSVLQLAAEVVEQKASAKGVPVELTCLVEEPVRVNAALLERAVANLVDNAVKYSEAGSPVRVSAALEGNDLVISVADRGCGIERVHLARIFERFYRVDKGRSRELGGTGLGLAIVRHIARLHGGTVSVESAPGKGSTFVIRLPQAAGPRRSAKADSSGPTDAT